MKRQSEKIFRKLPFSSDWKQTLTIEYNFTFFSPKAKKFIE